MPYYLGKFTEEEQKLFEKTNKTGRKHERPYEYHLDSIRRQSIPNPNKEGSKDRRTH